MIILSRYIYVFLIYALVAMVVLCLRHLYYFLPFLFSILGAFLFSSLLLKKCRKLTYVFTFFYGLFLSMELASLYATGKFIEVLTLANLGDYSDVGTHVINASLLIIGSSVFSALFMKGAKEFYCSVNVYILFIPIVFFYFMVEEPKPITIFFQTSYKYLEQSLYRPDKENALKQQKIYGKDWIYQNNNENIPNLRGKNVVTFFTEGLSLEVIDKFNGYPNLTPNVSNFLDRSLWFDNYFNHAAATYRGLRGQFYSSYQYTDSKGLKYVRSVYRFRESVLRSMADILREHGYHTYFFSAHRGNARLNTYLSTFGFDNVFTASDFKSDDVDLTDQEMFKYLKELLESNKLQEPYFLGIYNLGTHFGVSSPDLQYEKEPDNDILDVFYNFDAAFGGLIKAIENDEKLYEKTIFILTADHATYPSQLFKDTFHISRNHFIGKVPFAIWGKNIDAQKIDVNGRNSLDFAPTILHMLRMNSGHNYFLGCSLYDEKCQLPFEYYACTGGNPIYTKIHRNKEDIGDIDRIKKLIQDFYNLSETRVFEWNLKQ